MKDAGARRNAARIAGGGCLLCSKFIEDGVGVALTGLRVLDNHRHESGKSRGGDRCAGGALYQTVRSVQITRNAVLQVSFAKQVEAPGYGAASEERNVREVAHAIGGDPWAQLPGRLGVDGAFASRAPGC